MGRELLQFEDSRVQRARRIDRETISYKPFTTGLYNGACSLAFDSEDNFYFVTFGYLNGVENDYGKKFDSEGRVLSSFGGSAVTTRT